MSPPFRIASTTLTVPSSARPTSWLKVSRPVREPYTTLGLQHGTEPRRWRKIGVWESQEGSEEGSKYQIISKGEHTSPLSAPHTESAVSRKESSEMDSLSETQHHAGQSCASDPQHSSSWAIGNYTQQLWDGTMTEPGTLNFLLVNGRSVPLGRPSLPALAFLSGPSPHCFSSSASLSILGCIWDKVNSATQTRGCYGGGERGGGSSAEVQ